MSRALAKVLRTQRNFLRVSVDRSGKKRSPKQQAAVLNRDAEDAGRAVVGEPYSETGSASRYGARDREEFAQLLADLESGDFGADVLAVWETSRSSRQMEQSLPLVNALAAAGVLLWVHNLSRMFNMRNPHDRADFLSAAIKDELASAETSDRVLRDVETQAIAGEPHGLAPFGYRHEYDPDTGDLIARVVDEPKAALVREVFDRVRAGDSLKTIAEVFEKRGVRRVDRTTKKGNFIVGGPYSPQHLSQWLRNPAYVGIRVHQPGRRGQRKLDPAVKRYAAKWPRIVEPEVWTDVQAILADPKRSSYRPARAKHLTSGIARCARCGAEMRPTTTPHGRKSYRCHARGCATVPEAELDELALAVVATYLGSREYAALAQPDEATSVDLKVANAELADAARALHELAAAARIPPGKPGHISIATVAALEPALLERQAKARAKVDRLSAPKVPVGLLAPGADARARLDAATFEVRRTTVGALLVPAFVGQLLVLPVALGWGMRLGPVRTRVVFWHGADTFAGAVTWPYTTT